MCYPDLCKVLGIWVQGQQSCDCKNRHTPGWFSSGGLEPHCSCSCSTEFPVGTGLTPEEHTVSSALPQLSWGHPELSCLIKPSLLSLCKGSVYPNQSFKTWCWCRFSKLKPFKKERDRAPHKAGQVSAALAKVLNLGYVSVELPGQTWQNWGVGISLALKSLILFCQAATSSKFVLFSFWLPSAWWIEQWNLLLVAAKVFVVFSAGNITRSSRNFKLQVTNLCQGTF